MKMSVIGWIVVAGLLLFAPGRIGAQQAVAGETQASVSVLLRPAPGFPSAAPPQLPAIGVAAEMGFDAGPAGIHGRGGAAVRSPRPWWLYPAVGAGIGVVTLGGLAYHQCNQRNCNMDPFAFVIPGALVGATVGGFVAILTRAGASAFTPAAPPPPPAPRGG